MASLYLREVSLLLISFTRYSDLLLFQHEDVKPKVGPSGFDVLNDLQVILFIFLGKSDPQRQASVSRWNDLNGRLCLAGAQTGGSPLPFVHLTHTFGVGKLRSYEAKWLLTYGLFCCLTVLISC